MPPLKQAYNTKEVKEQIAFAWTMLHTASTTASVSQVFESTEVNAPGQGAGSTLGDEDDSTNVDDAGCFDNDLEELDAEELSYFVVEQPKVCVPRSPMVYFRGGSGVGNTYLSRLRDRVDCTNPDVASFTRDAAVFMLSFISLCAFSAQDNIIATEAEGAYMPLFLRLIYIEMAAFDKMSWSASLSAALKALDAKTLRRERVVEEVEWMLCSRRGAPHAPLCCHRGRAGPVSRAADWSVWPGLCEHGRRVSFYALQVVGHVRGGSGHHDAHQSACC